MEAGGDKDGIWTIMESGLQYVSVPSPTSTHLNLFLSISAIMSHIPYLLKFITAVMGRGGSLQRANMFGRGSVSRRLEVGANRKDLFYYLVRQHRDVGFDMLTSLGPITERRGTS